MPVRVLSTLEELRAHAGTWEAIFRDDPEASVHRSWPWQFSWARSTAEWHVAIASARREAGAILPFRIVRTDEGVRVLRLGGSPLAATSGLLSTPDPEPCAELARFFRSELDWDRLVWHDICDSRLDEFVAEISGRHDRCRIKERQMLSIIALPASWQSYLAGLSRSTRVNLRKRTRQVESLRGFRAQGPEPRPREADVLALLGLWRQRWGPQLKCRIDGIRSLFEAMADAGALRLMLLFDGDRPISGLAGFCDRGKTFHCFMTAHDDAYAKFSPSKVIMAHAIRWSIETGFRQFSLGRGPESYKDSLGASRHALRNVSLWRVSPVAASCGRLWRRISG